MRRNRTDLTATEAISLDAAYIYNDLSNWQIDYSNLSGWTLTGDPSDSPADEYLSAEESYEYVKSQWQTDPKQLIGHAELRRIYNQESEFVVTNVRGEWGRNAEAHVVHMADSANNTWIPAGLSGYELKWNIPKAKLTDEERRNRVLKKVWQGINNIGNGERVAITSSIESYKRDIASYEESLARMREELSKREKKLSKMSVAEITPADIESSMRDVLKHKKIQDVYVTKDGSIAIVTKMLYKTDPKTQEEDQEVEIGRFAIYLECSGSGTRWNICATNLDYADHNGYGHPNVSGGVCLGEHEREIRKCINLYMIADFFVFFFSQFPHDSGRPFTDPFEWLENKRKVKEEIPLRERL